MKRRPWAVALLVVWASAARASPAAPPPADATLSYGADRLQQLDLWRAQGAGRPAPLVLFVHAGGWKRGSKDNAASRWAPSHFPAQGYAYASINYRLVPAATVEQQADDVAHALRALLDRAASLGIDRRKVVLMGHSAGAHLVALVGTDERYLRSAGLSFADVAGVVANDGAPYDVPSQMRDAGRRARRMYADAFGSNPVRQRALSPTDNATARRSNTAAFPARDCAATCASTASWAIRTTPPRRRWTPGCARCSGSSRTRPRTHPPEAVGAAPRRECQRRPF